MKRHELEKLMTDIAESKVDISTVDEETKEQLLRLARKKIRMLIFQKWLLVFRDLSWIIVMVLILVLMYQIYVVLSGYFVSLTVP